MVRPRTTSKNRPPSICIAAQRAFARRSEPSPIRIMKITMTGIVTIRIAAEIQSVGMIQPIAAIGTTTASIICGK